MPKDNKLPVKIYQRKAWWEDLVKDVQDVVEESRICLT
jgi:hypothetical protein